MTTLTFNTVIEHSSDATFRVWGSEFSTKLAAVGLTNTADTGQINWTTVARPTTSLPNAAGYEIWRFADSTIYLKLEYGTDTNSCPAMWITVGTGSNGSGALTGQTSTRRIWTGNQNAASTVTAYNSYMCLTADAFSVAWKTNAFTSGTPLPLGVLVVGKTVDGAGAASTTGFGVFSSNNIATVASSLQSVRTAATAATFTGSASYCLVVGAVTSSTVGSDTQAYTCWLNVPQVVPFAWMAGYVISEVTELNTFAVAMVGAVSHTYLVLGQINTLTTGFAGLSQATYSVAIIYE
jgi:hypothetical protein